VALPSCVVYANTLHFRLNAQVVLKDLRGGLQDFAKVLHENFYKITEFVDMTFICDVEVIVYYVDDSTHEDVIARTRQAEEHHDKMFVLYDKDGNIEARYLGMVILETRPDGYRLRAVKDIKTS